MATFPSLHRFDFISPIYLHYSVYQTDRSLPKPESHTSITADLIYRPPFRTTILRRPEEVIYHHAGLYIDEFNRYQPPKTVADYNQWIEGVRRRSSIPTSGAMCDTRDQSFTFSIVAELNSCPELNIGILV